MKTFKQFIAENTHPMIDVDGVQKHRNNSEGRPIHHTDEGIRNFHRWFGDSKTVDEHGRPKVFYHGTTAHEDFSKFHNHDDAHYFSQHASVAASTERAGGWLDPDKFKGMGLPPEAHTPPDKLRVIPTYLKMHNPASMKDVSGNVRQSVPHMKSNGFDGFASDYEHIVFHPKQIKSAVGNNGNFSKDSEHIHEQAK